MSRVWHPLNNYKGLNEGGLGNLNYWVTVGISGKCEALEQRERLLLQSHQHFKLGRLQTTVKGHYNEEACRIFGLSLKLF